MRKHALFAAVAGFLPVLALAQPVQGDKEVTIAGSGRSDNDFNNNNLSITGSFGQYMTDNTLVGIRQGLTYVDPEIGNSQWTGATRLFADWHFGDRTAKARPYFGAHFGGVYGDDVRDSWTSGLDLGMKFYVQDRTFVNTHIDYQFAFRDTDDLEDNWDRGDYTYNIGVGYNF